MTDELEAARQRGVTEGQLKAIEALLTMQTSRMNTQDAKIDQIDKRVSIQEKISWAILGAVLLIQSSDVIRSYFGNVQ